jgi:hypothetical protein
MIDWSLYLVYAWIFLIGIFLYVLVGIFGILIVIFSNIDREKGKEYLKNITYGIFGGIIATILLELRGDGYKRLFFYIINMPLSLLTIFTFVLIGIVYLHLIDKLFYVLEEFENAKKDNKDYKVRFFKFIMDKKILFTLKVLFFGVIGVAISWYLSGRFALMADLKYIEIIITTAVFLAGFGLIALDKEDSVFFVNVKQIISWSLLSIICSFCYIIFQSSIVWGNMFFRLASGFLFFTMTLIFLLVIFHDNPYMKEIEKSKV